MVRRTCCGYGPFIPIQRRSSPVWGAAANEGSWEFSGDHCCAGDDAGVTTCATSQVPQCGYATTPAPLFGSESLRIESSTGTERLTFQDITAISPDMTSGCIVLVFHIESDDGGTDSNPILELRNGASSANYFVTWQGLTDEIGTGCGDGDVTSGEVALAEDTTYTIELDLVNATTMSAEMFAGSSSQGSSTCEGTGGDVNGFNGLRFLNAVTTGPSVIWDRNVGGIYAEACSSVPDP